MCGIAGLVCRGERIADPSSTADVLSAALAHRGPDGSGRWSSPDGDALLVHRRLAIIDLTPGGAQPMASPDGRYRVVFNGEVYNHAELRSAFESCGERFATRSDTEVLLRLIAREGPSGLARVRGMFALACWDRETGSLLLARDRFGIKPLYVAASARRLAFASELHALRAAGLAAGSPSPAGVLAFLSWGSVPPPLTWIEGAEMLTPGTWRLWGLDGRELRGTFADTRCPYRSAGRHSADEPDFRARVGAAVRDSVRAHLVADVPVAVFLSGGIDSGAIVSAAVSGGATDLRAFTVGFDGPMSEAVRAHETASAFGIPHDVLPVDASRVADELPTILARLDQPTIDGINTFYVSRAVAATGVKAVLSGVGGDELFGGYPSFARLPRAVMARRLAGPLWPIAARMGGAVVPERLRPRFRQFAASDGLIADAYRTQRGFLPFDELTALAGPALRDRWREAVDALRAAEAGRLGACSEETALASVARLESRMYLTSQLLRDADAMAMAHGLEVRTPFVDHELVGQVWPELGFHPRLIARKRLLSGTLERPLPRATALGPKQGFTLPFGRWLAGDLAPAIRDGMAGLAEAGWIAADAPRRVWSAWESGAAHWSRPWGLGVLGLLVARPGVARDS